MILMDITDVEAAAKVPYAKSMIVSFIISISCAEKTILEALLWNSI